MLRLLVHPVFAHILSNFAVALDSPMRSQNVASGSFEHVTQVQLERASTQQSTAISVSAQGEVRPAASINRRVVEDEVSADRKPGSIVGAEGAMSTSYGYAYSSYTSSSSYTFLNSFSSKPEHSKPHFKYINATDIETEMKWPGVMSSVPECWQGIFFMDQNYLSWPVLHDSSYAIQANVYGRNFVDYAVSVLDEWDGRCITFGYEDRSTFGYGEFRMELFVGCPAPDKEGHQMTFCMEDSFFTGPCDEGAVYVSDKKRESFGYSQTLKIERRKWGWNRITEAVPVSSLAMMLSPNGTEHYHYPVVPIVDSWGMRTKYYDIYLREANNKFSCTLEGTSELNLCPKNDNEDGVSIICSHKA